MVSSQRYEVRDVEKKIEVLEIRLDTGNCIPLLSEQSPWVSQQIELSARIHQFSSIHSLKLGCKAKENRKLLTNSSRKTLINNFLMPSKKYISYFQLIRGFKGYLSKVVRSKDATYT